MRLDAQEIHGRVNWPSVLVSLGIPETALCNRHGPCPACAGKDCFRFDHDKRGKGSFICSKASGKGGGALSGDGFTLLMHVHGWSFPEARQRVIEVAGLDESTAAPIAASAQPRKTRETETAQPTSRVLRIRRGSCAVSDCEQVVDYLTSRGLWPLPAGCSLRAHPSVDYFDDQARHIGSFPAIVGDLVDVAGELVSIHITHVPGGRKLDTHQPRKLLSKTVGRDGCAVRLLPAGDTLGIAEGIETALSAAVIDRLPVWAALNTSLLAKFEPPPQTQRLVIYADNDAPGLLAACRLMERLQARIRSGMTIEFRPPPAAAKDWNDVLTAQKGRSRT